MTMPKRLAGLLLAYALCAGCANAPANADAPRQPTLTLAQPPLMQAAQANAQIELTNQAMQAVQATQARAAVLTAQAATAAALPPSQTAQALALASTAQSVAATGTRLALSAYADTDYATATARAQATGWSVVAVQTADALTARAQAATATATAQRLYDAQRRERETATAKQEQAANERNLAQAGFYSDLQKWTAGGLALALVGSLVVLAGALANRIEADARGRAKAAEIRAQGEADAARTEADSKARMREVNAELWRLQLQAAAAHPQLPAPEVMDVTPETPKPVMPKPAPMQRAEAFAPESALIEIYQPHVAEMLAFLDECIGMVGADAIQLPAASEFANNTGRQPLVNELRSAGQIVTQRGRYSGGSFVARYKNLGELRNALANGQVILPPQPPH